VNPISPFPEAQIESLSRLLGECGTGDQITRALHDRGLEDHSGQSTKWRRLHWVFSDSQRQHGCADRIIDFIQSFLSPGRFVGNSGEFETYRIKRPATRKQFCVPRSEFRVSTRVGTIVDWVDEKGYGWVKSGEKRYFAHIKDFKRGQRPEGHIRHARGFHVHAPCEDGVTREPVRQ